jgi:hypothetical protein
MGLIQMIMILIKNLKSCNIHIVSKMSERNNPLKKLDEVIHERKHRINHVHSQIQLAMRRNELDTLAFLEPILEILKDIQKRLEVLEKH